MSKLNPWQHVRAPDVSRNPYIHPALPASPPAAGSGPLPSPGILPTVTNAGDYILLKNLRCVDADGKEFEKHDELYLAKDVVRKADGTHQSFTPYAAILHFQQQGNGLFLPSMALSCNILAALFSAAVDKDASGNYTLVKDPELKKILDQYKDHGAGWGWHNQNTVVDYNTERIIHYPTKEDFPSNGGTTDINASLRDRKELPFEKSRGGLLGVGATILERGKLEDKLTNPLVERFVKNYSGLGNPHLLIEMGNYFGKPAYVWFSDNITRCTDTRAAWLGCNGSGNFNLSASSDLGVTNAARGVRR